MVVRGRVPWATVGSHIIEQLHHQKLKSLLIFCPENMKAVSISYGFAAVTSLFCLRRKSIWKIVSTRMLASFTSLKRGSGWIWASTPEPHIHGAYTTACSPVWFGTIWAADSKQESDVSFLKSRHLLLLNSRGSLLALQLHDTILEKVYLPKYWLVPSSYYRQPISALDGITVIKEIGKDSKFYKTRIKFRSFRPSVVP